MSNLPSKPKSDALAGIRVLDFTAAMAGPYCTRYLADLGADVIKIEPFAGDFIRNRGPLRDGCSTPFGHFNCGKRSIALNLKHTEAPNIVRELALQSDVVVENFRPGVMQRLGFDYPQLNAINPRVIYCSISGYGQTGPSAQLPAIAPTIHASSGFDMENFLYQGDQARPAKTGTYIADMLGALFALGAIQTALFQRERTGMGQCIDTSLMDGMVNLLVYELQDAQFPPSYPRHLYQPVHSADGFVMVAPMTEANFEALSDTAGHPEWKSDPRFASPAARSRNWNTFMQAVEAWTSQHSSQECEDILLPAGVPCSRYKTAKDVLQDPYVESRGLFAQIRDAAGSFLVTNLAFQMTGARTDVRGTVPRLGEHTDDILSGLLKMNLPRIEALRATGVVR
jgi:crotonobetainyl-CoA:carnitine CoA-transferase CaiB-like acyl-CoA transferase